MTGPSWAEGDDGGDAQGCVLCGHHTMAHTDDGGAPAACTAAECRCPGFSEGWPPALPVVLLALLLLGIVAAFLTRGWTW